LQGQAVVEVLLANGADASREDSQGQTPLFLAAKTGRRKLVELLLDSAGPSALLHRDLQQRTVLHCAALAGASGVVQFLLWRGAARDARDVTSRTPLDYAEGEGHTEIIELLTSPHSGPDPGKFELPPDGGQIEGDGVEETAGDNGAALGAALGCSASFLVLCCVCYVARRKRAKVSTYTDHRSHGDSHLGPEIILESLKMSGSTHSTKGVGPQAERSPVTKARNYKRHVAPVTDGCESQTLKSLEQGEGRSKKPKEEGTRSPVLAIKPYVAGPEHAISWLQTRTRTPASAPAIESEMPVRPKVIGRAAKTPTQPRVSAKPKVAAKPKGRPKNSKTARPVMQP